MGLDRVLSWLVQSLALDYQRTHHVVFFVFEDVAMPDIFVVGLGWVGQAEFGSSWSARHVKGEAGGQVKSYRDDRHFAWMHFDGFFPAQLSFFGSARAAGHFYFALLDLERLTGKDLDVDEMEVDRMRIAGPAIFLAVRRCCL